MNTKYQYLLFFTFLLLCPTLSAQRVELKYDAAGNRIDSKTIMMRRVVEIEEEPAISEEESKEPEEKENSNERTPLIFTETFQEVNIHIYPNPTKGLLKVDVQNLPEKEKIVIYLYDLSGKQILSRAADFAPVELDITRQNNGMYILIIQIGENRSEWKIIKQ